MDGTKVGVLKETDEVSLGGFLKSENGGGLESGLRSELVGDLLNESLEGELPDEELGGLLVPPDLSGGDGSGPESVGLLDSSGGGGRLLGSLRVELFPGLLDSMRALSCGGLCSCHVVY